MRDRKFDEVWDSIQDNPFLWTLKGSTRHSQSLIYEFYQDTGSFTAQGVLGSSGKTVNGDNIFNFLGLSDSSLFDSGKWPEMEVFSVSFSMDNKDTFYPKMKAETLRAYANLCTVMGF